MSSLLDIVFFMDLNKAQMACEDAMFSFSGEKWPVLLLFMGNRLALPILKISLVFKIWEKTKDGKKKTLTISSHF